MTRHLRDLRLIALLAVILAFALVAVFAPHPSVDQIRQWGTSVGPAFPLVFFALHAIVTIAPVPRTLFTLSAGVLFGPLTALAVTIGASMVSAVLALLLVRAIGREAVAARMSHSALDSIDDSLRRRGWLAVGSLRLIAPVPFSLVNYACGVSAVRVTPFALATAAGLLPGTLAIVVIGGAIGGDTHPVLLVVSAVCIAIGLSGLFVDWRLSRNASSEPYVAETGQGQELDSVESSLED
ncbi:putative integral membrane protein [Rhodococcus sp. AW25M09]|uniref:TVP38/TMEM64 family protein n=1 Tax=Rhodococcus sp. AW25M09 TaxID=1268303 RepID=UPI0002ABFE78|nr:TVP38/TMEM64 family protein [Rhodococcus sp. AW25M09]CCQ16529.1 putative integral membrane protein [Rhodococcus sp. AW25M09]